jgi:hypothetical protein
MTPFNKMLRCPHCKGSGFSDEGKCTVCSGVGALYRNDGSPAKHDDAEKFFNDFDELYGGKARLYKL